MGLQKLHQGVRYSFLFSKFYKFAFSNANVDFKELESVECQVIVIVLVLFLKVCGLKVVVNDATVHIRVDNSRFLAKNKEFALQKIRSSLAFDNLLYKDVFEHSISACDDLKNCFVLLFLYYLPDFPVPQVMIKALLNCLIVVFLPVLED